MRVWCDVLVTTALVTSGCAVGTGAVSSEEDAKVGVVQAAESDDEEKNEFRDRKTEKKDLKKRKDGCGKDPRVALGLVSKDICVGADLFFRESFGGNGRACGTCHAAQFNFTIGPAFIDSLDNDDPLFVAENNPALAQLEKPELMRDFGLILENVDGAEDPTHKFVMRSVPHTFSLTTSITPAPIVNPDGTGADGTTQPPIERVGWGGDGAPSPGGLKQFQVGAIFQHYTKSLNRVAGVDFDLATDEQLSSIENFLRNLGRLADIPLASVSLTDPAAETGRTTFIASRCSGCHSNASASVAAGFNRNFNTGIETVRLPAVNAQNIPHDGGFGGGAPGAPFNHDADGDGTNDSFGNGTFSTPPLIEAADTAPFFHTNAFTTIEQAITFYTTPAFANSANGGGAAIPFSSTDIANVGKFLRTLNASFNCQLAIYRLQSVIQIADQYNNRFRGMQFGLIDTAQAEVKDARADLDAVGISSDASKKLKQADKALDKADSDSAANKRQQDAQDALDALQAANTSLGSGMQFMLGQGSLMF